MRPPPASRGQEVLRLVMGEHAVELQEPLEGQGNAERKAPAGPATRAPAKGQSRSSSACWPISVAIISVRGPPSSAGVT